jgi:hypothetical protein
MSGITTAPAFDRLRSALAASSYRHRARTVLYRWSSGYEAPHRDLGHHAELVTNNFTMRPAPETGLPSIQDRDAHLDNMAALPSGQRNAYQLRSLSIDHASADTARVMVTYDFETAGPTMTSAARMRSDVGLVQDPAERLPRIATMSEQILDRQDTPLSETYTEHRVLAFLHYWLSLLERPAADAEPLRELLDADLDMTLSDGRILHTFDDVAAWYAGAGELVDISTHHVINRTITPGRDDRHDLAVNFAWEGVTRQGRAMTARTRHHWTLAETGERYLRLRRFAVTILDPFTPVTAQQALAHHAANNAESAQD